MGNSHFELLGRASESFTRSLLYNEMLPTTAHLSSRGAFAPAIPTTSDACITERLLGLVEQRP